MRNNYPWCLFCRATSAAEGAAPTSPEFVFLLAWTVSISEPRIGVVSSTLTPACSCNFLEIKGPPVCVVTVNDRPALCSAVDQFAVQKIIVPFP